MTGIIIINHPKLAGKQMKYSNTNLPPNAFLKVFVNGSVQRVFFKDVSSYRKLKRKTTPPLPIYCKSNHCPLLSNDSSDEELSKAGETETHLLHTFP